MKELFPLVVVGSNSLNSKGGELFPTKSRGIVIFQSFMAPDEINYGLSSFFKLILAPRFDLQKLGIPGKFMRKHGEDLSDTISLNTPTGAEWEVKLVRENGKAWLQIGWPEFVEFYSISHWHFLMFRYKGHSRFDVFILDSSASEIKYRVDVNTRRANQKRKRGFTDSGHSAPPSSSKRVRFFDSGTACRRSSHGQVSIQNGSKKGVAVPEKVIGLRCGLSAEEEKKVENYECEHPSFVVKMKPSHVSGKFNVHIPLAFFRGYLKTEIGKFKFQSATGQTWLMNCSYKGETHVGFTKGWKQFAVDNKLRTGDICVFELIKGAKKMFRFGVIRAARENPCETYPEVKVEAD